MFMNFRGTPTWRPESSAQFVVILFYLAYVAVFPLPFRQARVARGHGDRGNKKTETGGRGEGYWRNFTFPLHPLPLFLTFCSHPMISCDLPLDLRERKRKKLLRSLYLTSSKTLLN